MGMYWQGVLVHSFLCTVNNIFVKKEEKKMTTYLLHAASKKKGKEKRVQAKMYCALYLIKPAQCNQRVKRRHCTLKFFPET